MSPLLSVAADPLEHPGPVVFFFIVTLGLIVSSTLLVRRVRDYELVILGLVVAAAAIGYSMLGFSFSFELKAGGDAGSAAAGGGFGGALGGAGGILMRIAVVLVLAGVARSLLLAWPGAVPTETPKP